LDIAKGVENEGNFHAKERICVIDHLLVYQRCRQADVWDLQAFSAALDLDEAGIDREGGGINATWRMYEGCKPTSFTWPNSE
jgi:hypothetical protein